MESHRKVVITYVRKGGRVEAGAHRDCCDYIFKVQGRRAETVSVGIAGGWHEVIPSLGKALKDEELIAIAKEFLERELTREWVPSREKNRLEIPHALMEYRIHNNSFPS